MTRYFPTPSQFEFGKLLEEYRNANGICSQHITFTCFKYA